MAADGEGEGEMVSERMVEGRPAAMSARISIYGKAVLSIIGLYGLSLVVVNVAGALVPLTDDLTGDVEESLRRSHVALAWIQLIPLLFWVPITGATWVATSKLVEDGNRADVVMSWMGRVLALSCLIVLAVTVVQRVAQPHEVHALSGTVKPLLLSLFWMSCLFLVLHVFRLHDQRRLMVLSGLLILYYLLCITWIHPLLAASFHGISGPFSLSLGVLVRLVGSVLVDGVYAVCLAWLAYRSIALLESERRDETRR